MSVKKNISPVTIFCGSLDEIATSIIEAFCNLGHKVIIFDTNARHGEMFISARKHLPLSFVHLQPQDKNYEVIFAKIFKEEEVENIITHSSELHLLSGNITAEDRESIINRSLENTQHFLEHCISHHQKSTISSIVNITLAPGYLHHTDSRMDEAIVQGSVSLGRMWALQLSGQQIRVNTIIPGFIKTEKTLQNFPQKISSVQDKIPLKRLGNIQELTSVVLFLCSSNSSYINGSVINVDGGYRWA